MLVMLLVLSPVLLFTFTTLRPSWIFVCFFVRFFRNGPVTGLWWIDSLSVLFFLLWLLFVSWSFSFDFLVGLGTNVAWFLVMFFMDFFFFVIMRRPFHMVRLSLERFFILIFGLAVGGRCLSVNCWPNTCEVLSASIIMFFLPCDNHWLSIQYVIVELVNYFFSSFFRIHSDKGISVWVARKAHLERHFFNTSTFHKMILKICFEYIAVCMNRQIWDKQFSHFRCPFKMACLWLCSSCFFG